MLMLKNKSYILLIPVLLFCSVLPSWGISARDISALCARIGPQDAIGVAAPDGKILFSKHAAALRIPASTFKLLTALTALHFLGPDYKFPTDFYVDAAHNLTIKGYGDPLLLSQNISAIAGHLAETQKTIHDIVIDDSYFKNPLAIPGTNSASLQPYDAPNGAVCVNFNTVYFTKKNGRFVSAEPQTPMLPIALNRIRKAACPSGRILLTSHEHEAALYAGQMFAYFLKEKGVAVSGKIRTGRVHPSTDRLVYRYVSPFPLTEVVARLMEYSNNFMANQLFISTGASAWGPPGTLSKGVQAAADYASKVLEIHPKIVEGSGICRRNRISVNMYLKILNAFQPYHHLLNEERTGVFYKTGTLTGIQTRAGYIADKNGKLYRFVIFINTAGKAVQPFVDRLVALIRGT